MIEVEPDFLKFFAYRLAYTRALFDLQNSQQDAINEEDIPRLMEILSHKQTIINEIDRQQQTFPQWQDSWEERRETLAAETKKECEGLFRETQQLLSDLLMQEQNNISQLSANRDHILNQLESISFAVQNQETYLRQPEQDVSLFDLKQ